MAPIALIGFGEAARAFAGAAGWRGATRTYDIKLDDAVARGGIERAAAAAGVGVAAGPADAVAGADAVISLVTAGQALAAAVDAAPFLAPGALFLDLNSVAPDTKRAAARIVERAGARYADVAVMAPVHPARLGVPLLAAGPHAAAAAAALTAVGFTHVAIAGSRVGDASSIKLVRSVMVKGIEALTAECLLAAEAAGVRGAVLASLDASWPGAGWTRRSDYNLDRMMVHGLRRADEMAEAVKMLDTLGTGAPMARATVARQRAIGALGVAAPAGLDAKLATLLTALLPVAERDAA